MSNAYSTRRTMKHISFFRVSFSQSKVMLNVPSETWEGEGALLRCSTTDSDPVTYVYWYKGTNTAANRIFIYIVSSDRGVKKVSFSNRIVVGRKLNGFYDLYINKTVVTDEGVYFCEINSGTNGATLMVNVKPESVSMNGLAQSVRENTVVEVTCDVSRVKPEVDIYWRKGQEGSLEKGTSSNVAHSSTSHGTFHLHSTYKVTFSRSDHNKKMYCLVTRPGTSTDVWASVSQTISVEYPPSTAVTHTTNWRPTEGESVTLTCDITDGNPRDDIKQVTWRKGNSQLPTSTHYLLSDKVLTIRSLDHSLDDGDYSCAATNAVGMGDFSAKVALLVNYKPILSMETPDPVVEGHPVTITCESQGARPAVNKVSWKKGQEVIRVTSDDRYTGGVVQSPSLTIKNAARSDAGQYTCQLDNNIGHNSKTVTLQVYYLPTTQVTQKSSGTPTEGEGHSVTLTCDIKDGRPKSDIKKVTWKKGGQEVKSSDRINSSGQNLTISSLDHSKDDGSYTCAAENAAGMGEFGDALQLHLMYAPNTEVTQKSSGNPIQEHSLTLTCHIIDGRPKDVIKKVTWKKGGQELASFDGQDLTITSLDHSKHDGSYTCAAENAAGQGGYGIAFQLDVYYKPTTLVTQKSSGKAIEGEEHSVTLTCDITDGRPKDDTKKVTWKKGEQEITFSNRINSSGRDLTITSLDHSKDDGSYTCAAENVAGMGEYGIAFQLRVLYRPFGQAKADQASVTVAVGGTVSLTCLAPSDPGYPAASWFYWRRENSDFHSNTTLLTLTPSNVKESGKYSCVAGNWLGQSDHSHWTTVTVQAPANVEYPRIDNIQRSPAFDDDFKMTCTVSGSGDLMVKWLKDGESVDTGFFGVPNIAVTSGHYMYGQTEAKNSTLTWKVTERARYFTCNNITHFDGHYTCAVSTQTADTMTHNESKAFIVNVQYAAHWATGPAVVAAAVDDVAVVIVCSVCANPQPHITWTFKNESLREGINVTEDRISFDVIRTDDFGFYQCSASNNFNGEDRNVTFPIELVASGPPKEPLGFAVLGNHTSAALTLRWQPGFHGGYSPQEFILEYETSDKSLTMMKRISTGDQVKWYQATVVGLMPETDYVFSIHAENKCPQDKGSNRSSIVQTTGRTTAAPQITIKSVSVTEDHMTVTWSYSSNSLRRHRRSTSTNVSVVIHYKTHGGPENRYPLNGTLSAQMKEVTINERFDTEAKYTVWLTVYEGLLAVSSQTTTIFEANFLKKTASSKEIPVAVISGSVTAVIVIVIVISLISILLYRRHNKSKDCKGESSKPGSMLMVHREHEMVHGYNNIGCDETQPTEDSNGGVAYAQVNKKKVKEEAKDVDEDDNDNDKDEDALTYTTVVGTKATGANKAKESKKGENEKMENAKDDEDGDVVYIEVKTKPKQAQAATAAKKPEGENPPIAPKPKGNGKSENGVIPPTSPKPKKHGKKEKTKGKKETKKPDGVVYVNVNAANAENSTDDNLYINVEKPGNSPTQPPHENVGPDGTIYADLSFAASTPPAVKHDKDEDDDDDNVVYAAINFTKK